MTRTEIVSEILDLAQRMIRIPSITVGLEPRLVAVREAADFISAYLQDNGLQVRRFDEGKYPALLAGFPGKLYAPVMLGGHFDVVAPEPDDSHFNPRIVDDYLYGRGSADMKVVVATYMVWMKYRLDRGEPYPGVNLLLVGNEETGEEEPMGTPFVFEALRKGGEGEPAYQPSFFIAGERTEERGDELWGRVCTENRGVIRFQVFAEGQRGHSGAGTFQDDLLTTLLKIRDEISGEFENIFRFKDGSDWISTIRFPFLQVGVPGIYNITPDTGVLGVEIRPVPQDDLRPLLKVIDSYQEQVGIQITNLVVDPGVICPPDDPHLGLLLSAVEEVSGQPASLGRKLAGTSARFAPGGRGVVWGQSGQFPHSRDERHFIPSIYPYFQVLEAFSDRLIASQAEARILSEGME